MSAPFYDRLVEYYLNVGKVLRGEAEASSIFPNSSDIGTNREVIYAEFLKQHAPSKCQVRLGGYLFHENGQESKQLDVIVTTDTAPRFDFYSTKGGKSFSCVEGALGVFSIKSYLDKAQLFESLLNIASIPPTSSLAGRIPPKFVIADYDDWPYKFIYASDGMSGETLKEHLLSFYREHPTIPHTRRPNIIHVAGKLFSIRTKANGWNASIDSPENQAPVGEFGTMVYEPDVQAIMWTLHFLQLAAEASTQILFSNGNMLVGISAALRRRRDAKR